MLGGFSFRAGEHTTSAVRKIAGPNQNDYNFGKNAIGNLPEKRARKTCPGARVPLGPRPKGSPGAWAQGFYLLIYLIISILFFLVEKVQTAKIAISAEFLLNLAPVRRRCNENRYPRGF